MSPLYTINIMADTGGIEKDLQMYEEDETYQVLFERMEEKRQAILNNPNTSDEEKVSLIKALFKPERDKNPQPVVNSTLWIEIDD